MTRAVAAKRRRAKAARAADAVQLTDIPNIGPSIAQDLRRIGILTPAQLVGRDPFALYRSSNAQRGLRQDPCLLDCFIAAVRFMQGAPATPWWHYTAERKRLLAASQGA